MLEIVGFSLRVPGASNKEALWQMLKSEHNSITEIPEDRWSHFRYLHPRQGEPGKTYTFKAGVLDDLWGFDPSAFAISPREAEQMDPQQRLLLQLTWEAIEDAGISPDTIAGDNVGVYVGASALDYANESLFDPNVATGHFMTGNTLSILSNRLSYIFDLRGPSFTVDTACSSSLVALHEAYRDLNTGKIDCAVVAGVNVLASPFPFIGFAQATMLSPDGQCKAFDANGNGYVRSEGGVVLIIRRKDAPRWNGQRSHADIAACDISSDGRTVGMSLPSESAQAALLERVYKTHGIDPNQLVFIEAHGTGTRVGDPAEAHSIGQTLAQKRRTPLPIGSVKTNLGHLEPASGLAGLAKAILALKHDFLPASLHFQDPNPNIDFDALNIQVAAKGVSLPREGTPRYAGVNSFGFGGTNAHVIIRDADTPVSNVARLKKTQQNAINLLLSAPTKETLTKLARTYACSDVFENQDAQHVCAASFHRKRLFKERAVFTGNNVAALQTALRDFTEAKETASVCYSDKPAVTGKCAFVFSGNGSQWAGMGRDAYASNAIFRKAFRHLDRLFESLAGWSLTTSLFSETLEEDLGQTSKAQPLLFAVQVALCRALSEYSLNPDMVLGHSIGEVAAAHISGALSLETAVNLVYHRSTEQEVVSGHGTMGALMQPADDAQRLISQSGFKSIEIAAENSPKSVSLTGSREDMEGFAKFARSNQIAFRKVALNYPFHSKLIEPVQLPFRNAIGNIIATSTDIPFISTVSGAVIEGPELTADYWWRNLRDPVLFFKAVATAIDLGADVFIEIGPKPILQSYVRQVVTEKGGKGAVLGSLSTDFPLNLDPVMQLVVRAYLAGVKVDTRMLFGVNPDEQITLPPLPWHNKSFKFENSPEAHTDLFRGSDHPLLGWRPNANFNVWTTHLDRFTLPFLNDHVINGQMIFPGAGYVEMAFAAGTAFYHTSALELRSMDILQALILSDDYLMEVRTEICAETGTVKISSRVRLSADDWTLNAIGRIGKIAGTAPSIQLDFEAARLVYTGDEIHKAALGYGLEFGSSFQRTQNVSQVDEATFIVHLSTLEEEDKIPAFGFHPAELDGCFHGLLALFGEVTAQNNNSKAYIPIFFESIRQFQHGVSPAYVRIQIKRASALSLLADFQIFDEDDNIIAIIKGGRFKATKLNQRANSSDLVYRVEAKLLRNPAQLPSKLENPFPQIEPYIAQKLLNSESTEERDAYLLLNAAAQRTAYDVICRFADSEQVINTASLPVTRRQYFVQLLNILKEAGAATSCGPDLTELSSDFDLPDFDTLAASVIEESPKDIAAVTLLANTRRYVLNCTEEISTELGDFEHSAAILEHYWQASPEAQTRRGVASDWLSTVTSNWDHNVPLQVLDLSGSGLNLAHDLRELRPECPFRVIIADSQHKNAARLSASTFEDPDIRVIDTSASENASNWDAVWQQGPFDIVISSGLLHTAYHNEPDFFSRLSKSIAPGGQFFAIEPVSDVFYYVTFGLSDGWFEASRSDHLLNGAIKNTREWCDQLTSTSFDKPYASEALIEGSTISILQAGAASNHQEYIAPPLKECEAIVIVAGHSEQEQDIAHAIQNDVRLASCSITIVNADHEAFDLNEASGWKTALVGSTFLEAQSKAIVHLYGLVNTGDSAVDQIMKRCATCVGLVKAYPGLSGQLALIAPGGSGLNSSESSPPQSAAWTFSRVLANEAPELSPRALDISLKRPFADIANAIIQSLFLPSQENEFCHIEQTHAASRVQSGFAQTFLTPTDRVALELSETGSLNYLRWQKQQPTQLDEDAVEIQVAATGINFRDVMWSLGMLPEEALENGYGGPSLGLEISGVVSCVGASVSNLCVGDKVVAFTSGGYATFVTCPEYAVVKLDEDEDLIAAATYPVAFLTAYYSLIHLGRLKEDQWVLIHGAAGSVGLAALQIAKHVGANVIATAGSEEKREVLRLLGADHILNSRNLEFADHVMNLTGGKGVHAVLNSLAGEAMEASINVVRPFGCFLELGKRDYYANTKVGLRPFRHNLSYFGIDLDQILLNESNLARELIEEVFLLIKEGIFTPLPYRVFEGRNVQDAFRLMQQSQHIGKVLVTPPKPETVKVAKAHRKLIFSSEGQHVVIGGLGGVGLEICRWLADNGACRIVMTSRSATVSPQHQQLFDELAQKGVLVSALKCDVTDHAALSSMLTELRRSAPLKSIIHAAMILDDGIIQKMDERRFRKVLLPKVQGASLLNDLTSEDELDHFILFSSATTLIGNSGQSNYVAANGYLEGLARARRKAGKPAIAVGWGAIGDVGILARDNNTSKKLSRHLGETTIKAREGLDTLKSVIEQDDGSPRAAVVHIGRFAWGVAEQTLPLLGKPMFSQIVKSNDLDRDSTGSADILALIAGKEDKQAQEIVGNILATEIGRILRLPAEDISQERPLAELGMDSLMGLELRISIQNRFDLEIPILSISGGTCLGDFSGQILQKLRKRETLDNSAPEIIPNELANQHLSDQLDDTQRNALHEILNTQYDKTTKVLSS